MEKLCRRSEISCVPRGRVRKPADVNFVPKKLFLQEKITSAFHYRRKKCCYLLGEIEKAYLVRTDFFCLPE